MDTTENYQSVTCDEYDNVFSNAFDNDKAVSISGLSDKLSIINAIENY